MTDPEIGIGGEAGEQRLRRGRIRGDDHAHSDLPAGGGGGQRSRRAACVADRGAYDAMVDVRGEA